MKALVFLAQNTHLETDRLLLRPMTVDDLRDYHEYTSNSELLRYDYPEHESIEESLESLVTWNLSQPLGRYGIELKADNRLIGNISLRVNAEEDTVAEIGYTLHPAYHAKGYATEAAQALLRLAQQIPTIKTVVGHVDNRNLASIRVLEKLGMELVSETDKINLRGENIISRKYEINVKDLNKEQTE